VNENNWDNYIDGWNIYLDIKNEFKR